MPALAAILFDLDQTLYHPTSGLLQAGDRRITEFLARHQGLAWEAADELRQRLWRQYGTTARGAETEFGVVQRELYEYTQLALDPAQYLQPVPEVSAMLAALPVERYVATNSLALYAERVLAALGLGDHFAQILDIALMGWHPKPEPEAYAALLAAVDLPARRVAFVDDFSWNLPPAAALGMYTIYLGEDEDAEADLILTDLLDLPAALQEAGVTWTAR